MTLFWERMPDLRERIPNLWEKIPGLREKIPDVWEKIHDLREKFPDSWEKMPDLWEKIPNLREKIPDVLEKIPGFWEGKETSGGMLYMTLRAKLSKFTSQLFIGSEYFWHIKYLTPSLETVKTANYSRKVLDYWILYLIMP